MNKKIVSGQKLQQILDKIRTHKKIVFTNGCFDLLHIGHVTLLQKARALGDVLVLGLNSDKSLQGLKGPKRPLVDQKSRAQVLAALECVDYIVIFGEQTPEKLLSKLRPHILVKGGDYKISEIAGRQYAQKVVRVKLVQGRSTTNLIEKILESYAKK